LSTWLHRLAVDAVLEARRRAARREARVASSADPAGLEQTPAPLAQAGSPDLERAIAALPAGARLVFVLHDVEGYQHDEIAAMTGIAEGTSKAQLHRARRLLREALAR
jgi:RNA polymerase sigma-70 factor (ECF subfamily)